MFAAICFIACSFRSQRSVNNSQPNFVTCSRLAIIHTQSLSVDTHPVVSVLMEAMRLDASHTVQELSFHLFLVYGAVR